jgi:hypothetical protein
MPDRDHVRVAWEWVAPVVTGTVGVAGIITTYLSGNRQTSTALTGAQRQVNAQAAVAREERSQRRLETAYVELQRAVDRYASWADATMPLNSPPGYDAHPLPPPGSVVEEASALQVYWSPTVRTLVTSWAAARNKFAVNASVARTNALQGRYPAEAWQKAPQLNGELHDAADKLLAQMNAELLPTAAG